MGAHAMMRVGFNAYLLSSPHLRGWNRYTVNLLAALPAHGVRPVLYSREPVHPDHRDRLPPGSFEERVGPWMRYLVWENWYLPRQLRTDRIDVFHCPMNYGMPWTTHCPRVLTLHDAIDEIYYRPRTWRERWRPGALRAKLANWAARHRAHHVITVSEHARGDIVRHLRVPARRVTVTHEAADPVFHQPVEASHSARVRETCNLPRPYFLYVGGWERRKNVPFLVRAFAAARLTGVDLVLAGGKEHERAALLELSSGLGCADRVKLLGFIPDGDLPAVYAGAIAFVYPSEYEGFGLQLVEAMAVGCPVLASRASCLPEVLGDGGETFSLDSPTELTALLQRVATEDTFRQNLVTRAKTRSVAFSWDRTAAETAHIYRTVLGR